MHRFYIMCVSVAIQTGYRAFASLYMTSSPDEYRWGQWPSYNSIGKGGRMICIRNRTMWRELSCLPAKVIYPNYLPNYARTTCLRRLMMHIRGDAECWLISVLLKLRGFNPGRQKVISISQITLLSLLLCGKVIFHSNITESFPMRPSNYKPILDHVKPWNRTRNNLLSEPVTVSWSKFASRAWDEIRLIVNFKSKLIQ